MYNKLARQSNLFEVMLCCTVLVILVTTKITNAAEDLEEVKPRRGGTVGLFAFPRVGRSDPELLENWDSSDFNPYSMEDYDLLPREEIKRQYLVPFPRVGRSSGYKFYPKYAMKNVAKRANGVGANGGMWFGPRLGRVQKRNAETNTVQGDQL